MRGFRAMVRQTFQELKRLRLMLYLMLLSVLILEFSGLGETSSWRYRLHKANIVTSGIILAHFAWVQLMYYFDMKDRIENGAPQDNVAAAIIIFRGLFYWAVISAFAGGM